MNLLKFWMKALFCHHEYKWTHNFYGDTIIAHNGKRSRWECVRCGWLQFRDDLHEPPKQKKSFRIQEPTGPF